MANLGSLVFQVEADTSGLRRAEGDVRSSANRMAQAMEQVNQVPMRQLVTELIGVAGAAGAAYQAGSMLASGLRMATEAAVQYNSEMESSTTGVAALLAAQGKFTTSSGEQLKGIDKVNAALSVSDGIVRQLQIDNLQTTATFGQLFSAFQEALAPGQAIKWSTDQIEKFSVAAAQAAAAIKLPLDQLGQETRAILSGDIDRNARIAKVLGITPEDWRRYQGDADGYFNYVMSKMKAFKDFGGITANTYSGLMSNMEDAIGKLLGTGTMPFFEELKSSIKEWYDGIVLVDEKTKTIRLNPAFLDDVRVLNELLVGGLDVLKFMGKGVSGITIEPVKFLMLPKMVTSSGEVDMTARAISQEISKGVADAEDALSRISRFQNQTLAGAFGSPFENLNIIKDRITAGFNLDQAIQNLQNLQSQMQSAGLDTSKLSDLIKALESGNLEAARAMMDSANSLNNYTYSANQAAISTADLKDRLRDLAGISLDRLGKSLDETIASAQAKVAALQSGKDVSSEVAKAKNLREWEAKKYWAEYVGANDTDMEKIQEERGKIDAAAYWDSYASGLQSSMKESAKSAKTAAGANMGFEDLDKQLMGVERQVMRSLGEITQASVDMQSDIAENSGDRLRADEIRIDQWKRVQIQAFAEQVEAAQQAYDEIEQRAIKAMAKGGVISPEAQAEMERIKASVGGLRAEMEEYNGIIEQSAENQKRWSAEMNKANDALSIAQLNQEYVKLVGTRQQLLEVELALIEAQRQRDVIGKSSEQQDMINLIAKAREQQAVLRETGSVLDGMKEGFRQMGIAAESNFEIGARLVGDLKGDVDSFLDKVATDFDNIGDHLRNLAADMLSTFGKAMFDTAVSGILKQLNGGSTQAGAGAGTAQQEGSGLTGILSKAFGLGSITEGAAKDRQTATMNVQAGVVNVGGAGVPGISSNGVGDVTGVVSDLAGGSKDVQAAAAGVKESMFSATGMMGSVFNSIMGFFDSIISGIGSLFGGGGGGGILSSIFSLIGSAAGVYHDGWDGKSAPTMVRSWNRRTGYGLGPRERLAVLEEGERITAAGEADRMARSELRGDRDHELPTIEVSVYKPGPDTRVTGRFRTSETRNVREDRSRFDRHQW